MRVTIVDGTQQLPQALLTFDGIHPVGIAFKILKDSALNKFENQVQFALASKNFDQIDNIVVLQLLSDTGAWL